MLFKFMNFLSLVLLIQYIILLITNFYYIVLQKKVYLSPRFYRAQMQFTKLGAVFFHLNEHDVHLIGRRQRLIQ